MQTQIFLTTMTTVGLIVSAFSASAQSPKAATNVGTLTCLVAQAQDERNSVVRELSCTFQPTIGAAAKFTGIVKRFGTGIGGGAKTVMVWSVLAPRMDLEPRQLAGRYVGKFGAASTDRGGLVGGSANAIRLDPLTKPPASNAAISVIELELSAMRA